ncbi:non-ribosomal peptide synthetase [Mariniradius sediminis]|uniref:Amino acid adenylation domain-containing protein n=1 Tax=Mariniradius sediminis TaxID=2909237 RepID=A0ABS9BRM9_9BACT|nr:non-ribosomal peptide synthetase [Mariniradius sediminis]MCF1750135.1 amino acid adenylation domain-containing protein [Mariniradius sediminis]
MQLNSAAHNPFEGPAIEKVGGLVDAQKEVWLSCILGGKEANLSYNQSISLDLQGRLDLDCLEKACYGLVERHEALRMAFAPNGKQFILYEEMPIPFQKEDYSSLDADSQRNALSTFLEGEVLRVFDLQQGPLIHFSLLKFSESHYHFTITAHHLIADGWSLGLLMEEISQQYNAFVSGQEPTLPQPMPFSQYAAEMETYSQSEAYQETERYWVEKFTPVPSQLELPTDRPRPKERTYNAQRDDFHLPQDLVDGLKTLSKKSNTSLVNTIMAAFEIFLHKITGQEDIVYGLPAAGQAATGNLTLVGHCVNLLPLRTKIQAELNFQQYLAKRKSELLDDYDHQQFTFGNLIKILGIPRDPSRIPLVPIMFNVDLGMDDPIRFEGLQHKLISNPRKFETFEIFLNLSSAAGTLVLEWSYNTDLFSPATVSYWMEGFTDIIRQAVDSPEIPISIWTFNADRMAEKLREWNNTEIELPVRHSFLEIFWENAKANPHAAALIADGKSMDYATLRRFSHGLAEHLAKQGIRSGDVVAVMLDRNEKLLPALLGVLELGAAYVPLDPGFPTERLGYMMQDSGAKLLLTEPQYSRNFADLLPVLALEDVYPFAKNNKTHFEVPPFDSLAYILYTSGSTGKPKGVRIPHGNLLNFLVSMQQEPGLSAGETLLAITTVSFDIAGLELFLPLIAGATVLLASSEQAKDGRALLQLMEQHQIGMMQATPATWRMLILAGWSKSPAFKLLCGGEALSEDLAEKLIERVGPFWNVYGPTETTIWSSIKRIAKSTDISIGRPIANTQIYILDAQGQHCPMGRVGEICIGGLGVAEGYHDRPELTAEKFIADPGPDLRTTKCYRTGDLGKFLANGEIVCLGRIDFQVKIRGYRIELGEIESKLNQIPGVHQAAVNAVPDKYGNNYLVGYLVLEDGETKSQESRFFTEIKAHLKESLPDYMVPAEWMVLDALPLTQNNKVDRKRLPVPQQGQNDQAGPVEEPADSFEQTVAGIWQKVLRREKIHRKSDFFELGGHSLMAVELMVLLERETGLKLPVNSIFRFPILQDFARLLHPQNEVEISWKSVVPIKPNGSKIPLFLIHGAGANITPFYGLAEHLDAEQPVYGIQAKGLDGKEEPLHTIEEMAAYYLEEIRQVHPKGPFHVGGQSFGAYVAFEMAKQIKSKGEPLGRVFLFDVSAYQSDTKMDAWDQFKLKVSQQLEKRVVDVKLAILHPDSFKRMKMNSFARKKGFAQRWFNKEKSNLESDAFLTIEKIRKINHKAMDNYVLSRYNGEIVLFKAKIKTFLVGDTKFYGWDNYAKAVLPVEVEGDHNSMVDDSRLRIDFSRKMQDLMDTLS